MDDPFMRPDDVRYAQILTDAAISVLRIMATDRFSVSAMARWMKVEPPAVLGQYSRSRVLQLVCICFTERWLSWSSTPDDEPTDAPFLLRLPGTAAEVHGVRVLAALRELARGEFMR